MSSTNSSDTLTPQVEVEPIGTAFTNTATNSGSTVAYSGSPVTGTVTVTGLTSGTTYHWQAKVTNSAGDSSWVPMGGSPDFGIDTSPPTGGAFTINSGATSTNSTAVTLNITCLTDAWTPVQMAYGNSSGPTNWTTCAATQAHTLTSGDGSKTVYVRFEDGGGNATSDLTQNITLDTTGPALAFSDDVEAGPVKSDTITADWGDATVKKWDYNDSTTCSTTSSDYHKTNSDSMDQTDQTNNGSWICLYAEDALGNKSTLASANPINIDITPPETFIDSEPDNPINSSSATFAFHATETSTFQCKLDSDSYSRCTSPKNYTSLFDGSHTFYVKATDTAGNEDPTPASYTWTVGTPPAAPSGLSVQ